MFEIVSVIITLIITYAIGSYIEKNHFKKIQQREIALIKKPIISYGAKKWTTKREVKKIEMVTGEVVISGDYFKNFVASLKNLFGGRLTTFESIMDRARREAILRMREKAKTAHIIVNTRIETVMLDEDNGCQNEANKIPKCAVIAYGTAVTYAPQK